MRLGSSIIGGKPMRIPGIVDVYQVGNEWIARSWPKPQKQPDSAAQLLWRQKFRDAHALIKFLPEQCLDAWRRIECPPGKMWLDVAMTSVMTYPAMFTPPRCVCPVDLGLYILPEENPFGAWAYALGGRSRTPNWAAYVNATWFHLGTMWRDVLRWHDAGWICARGKRPKKRWVPKYVRAHVEGNGYGWIADDWVYYFFTTNAPVTTGLSLSSLFTYYDPSLKETKWALVAPPLYFYPEAWPPPWWT